MRRLITWVLMAPAAFSLAKMMFGMMLILAAVGFGALYLYASAQPEKLPGGSTVAGVDVSGLTGDTAQAKLTADWRRRTEPGDRLVAGRRSWPLSAERLGVTSDRDELLADAVAEVHDTADIKRLLLGHPDARTFDEQVSYDRRAVDRLIAKVARRVARPAVDAKLKLTPGGPQVVPAVDGRRLDRDGLAQDIIDAVTSAGTQKIRVRTVAVRAKVRTAAQLKAKYPAALVADRTSFKLRLYRGADLVKTYSIAVGSAGHDTPAGAYTIANKAVDPTWHVPDSDWAGELAGTTVPGGAPNNPLKARWLGIVDGVGIHGTAEDASIGSAASHGCLRMRVADVIDLYPRVPVGAPILIV